MTVESGTGRFSRVSGALQFKGWARVTKPATGEGIGFFALDGDLEGVPGARAWKSSTRAYGGTGHTQGLNFVFEGQGRASHLGKLLLEGRNVPTDPINGFVGIIDGKVVLIQTVEEIWRGPNGDTVAAHSVGYLYANPVTLPDGSTGPDLSKVVVTENYTTILQATGRFTGLQGVYRTGGPIVPVDTSTVTIPQFKGPGQILPPSRSPWGR